MEPAFRQDAPRPLFCFNQFGGPERAMSREGDVHGAKRNRWVQGFDMMHTVKENLTYRAVWPRILPQKRKGRP